MKKNKYVPRKKTVALNVVRENEDGEFQVFQIYAGMSIPLLGYRYKGEFVPRPARTMREAFDRLYNEYYD